MKVVIFPIVAAIGFLALLVLYLAGAGYQQGAFELGEAFTLLRYGALAGIAGTGLVIFYLLWQRPAGVRLIVLCVSAVCGLVAFYLPYRQQQIAESLPLIHDITTDTEDPPAFEAVIPLRGGAPNPPEYDGAEVAAQQLEAYPDIRSVVYVQSPDEVFTAARELVGDMDWELVEADPAAGRIEAVATTRWFGFSDDVVIRLEPGAGGSTVFDMRSKSRVGRSDIGVNASRIREFIDALNARLDTGASES